MRRRFIKEQVLNRQIVTSSAPHNLAVTLRKMIRGGRWIAEGRLPSLRKLAGEFDVSVPAVQAALQILQAEGLVVMHDRRGAFINRAGFRAAGSTFVGLLVPFQTRDIDERREAALRDHLSFALDADEWSSHINRAFEQTLRAHELDLMVLPVAIDQLDLATATTQRIDRLGTPMAGVLTSGQEFSQPLARDLDKRDIPWITINPMTPHSVYNFVASDNLHGAKRVGRCLAGMGVRRLLVLSRSMASFRTDVEKVLGLYQGYLEREVPADQIVVQPVNANDEASGYHVVQARLAGSDWRPQAIFAVSDMLALGAIRALREAGLGVPEDVGVIGSTGLDLATQTDPPLTTLAQPMAEMGRQAAQMLTFMIREGVRRMVGRRIPGPLVFRESINISTELRREAEREFQQTVDQLQNVADDTVQATIGLVDSRYGNFADGAVGSNTSAGD